MYRSRFVHQTQVLSAEISRYLCFCNEISRDAFGQEHANGTFAAGLPGIHDVNLVTRADCSNPAAKSAPSGASSAQNAPVSQWWTRHIASIFGGLALPLAPDATSVELVCVGLRCPHYPRSVSHLPGPAKKNEFSS